MSSDLPRLHVMHVPGADRQRDAIVALLREKADPCVHEDSDRRGCMANWLDTVECAARNDSRMPWSVILSDDAEPLAGWQTHLAMATRFSPQPFLGLTHFGGYGAEALRKGAPYATGSYLLWGGAVALHRSVVPGLNEWAHKIVELTGYKHDDVLTCAYARKAKYGTALVARAIFGQSNDIKSMIGHHTPVREPSTTIANSHGPSYVTTPRAVRVVRSGGEGDISKLNAIGGSW